MPTRTIEAARASPGAAGPSFPDADAFAAAARAHPLFAPDLPVVVARAPGRLDVLGGISDYAGGLVLGLPLAAAALAAVQVVDDGRVVAVSGERRVSLPAVDLLEAPLEELARRLARDRAWATYVLGPVALLAREERLAPPGLRVVLDSAVPEGRGLGSSAAVEIAVASAVASALGRPLEPRRLALLGQRAEHLVAGAPCGSMDQMVAACGQAGHLLALSCRPAEVVGSFPLPSGLAVWGIDSGSPHAVRAAPYRRARSASFMGKALLDRPVDYLCALRPRDVDAALLPEELSGDAFLRGHGPLEDDLSVVEPDVDYPVRAATLHPIEEQVRVEAFLELLDGAATARGARRLGDLLHASHASYSRCGLGTPATDGIVEAVRAAGWRSGLIGARVSGGGGGGAVAVLGREDAEPVVGRIAATLGAGLVGGSSAGAAAFGTRVL